MTKFARLADIAKWCKVDYIYAEEAVFSVMPVFTKGQLKYPVRAALEAIITYADAHAECDGYAYKSKWRGKSGKSKLCDMWRECRNNARVTLERLNALEEGENA